MAASGIADAVFVHAKRFVASARSHAGAMAMATAAIRALFRAEPTDDLAEAEGGAAIISMAAISRSP